MSFLKTIGRTFLVFWSRIGKAPGYLYQVVDRYGKDLYDGLLWAKVTGGDEILCDIRDHVQQRIYFFGAYEPIESYLFTHLMDEQAIVIDAGANIGFYSLMSAQQLSPRGQVHAFEPVPINFEKLKENIKRNHKESLITLNQMGLYHEKAELEFSCDNEKENNLGAYTAGQTSGDGPKFFCPLIPLDQYVTDKNLERVDFIKMDIEGAELSALRGASQTLSKFKPILLLEVCAQTCQQFDYSPTELWDFLKGFGYKAYEVGSSPENSRPLENFDNIVQSNVLLYHGELPKLLQEGWSYKGIKAYYAKRV